MDKKALMVVPELSGELLPEATSFDGTTDYLSRTSDLTGNTDSKTLTFSCWVYIPKQSTLNYLYYSELSGEERVYAIIDSNGFEFSGRNSSGSNQVLSLISPSNLPAEKWTHILFSVDLSNSANRSLYIDDVLVTPNWNRYDNESIDFTVDTHEISKDSEQMEAHLFIDHTYRDLSVEANRRLFITEDLKPATGQAALHPILYLPMSDAATAHINKGTGGNFVQNGTLDTAQRGPNQWNCVASKCGSANKIFDSVFSFPSSKQITISFTLSMDEGVTEYPIEFGSNVLTVQYRSTEELRISNSTKSLEWDSGENTVPTGSTVSFQVSIDTSVPTAIMKINGKDITTTPADLTKDDLFSSTGLTFLQYFNGAMGELWIDDSFIDLDANNPFWDVVHKPVRQVLQETGATPLVAMPISADNPILNLGTTGSFSLVGNDLTGARSASEFWARCARFDGSTGYLVGSLPVTKLTKTLTVVFALNRGASTSGNELISQFIGQGSSLPNDIRLDTSERLLFTFENSSGTAIFQATGVKRSSGVDFDAEGPFDIVFLSIDLLNTNSSIFVGSNDQSSLISIETNDSIPLDSTKAFAIGSSVSGGINYYEGNIGLFYFSDEFIDFSQESNRNLFVDQLGYPKDLSKQIDAELIPTPLIYLPFDEQDNLGKNLGTSGDFTVNGGVISGSDVDQYV